MIFFIFVLQISLCESLDRTVKLTDSVTDSLERLTILQIQHFNMYNKFNLENKIQIKTE